MDLLTLIESNKEEILTLSKQHGTKNVRIFGSAVRGDSTPDSDIDFLVDLEKETSLLDLGGLLIILQELLGRKVDIVTEKGLHWYIKDTILKEARPL